MRQGLAINRPGPARCKSLSRNDLHQRAFFIAGLLTLETAELQLRRNIHQQGENMSIVKFSPANSKIEALYHVSELSKYFENNRRIYSFDLLSGHSCPFANNCLSRAVADQNGKRKILDGKNTKFRCFSASQEVLFTSVFELRKNNYETLRNLTSEEMFDIIISSLPENTGIVRLHVAGDFFSLSYLRAWLRVAMYRPDILFYCYTKSLPLLYGAIIDRLVPENFIYTASRGGTHDKLIKICGFREAVVVFSEKEAFDLGLEIDHDDSHAARPSLRKNNFALLIHGTQPAGTPAAAALRELRKAGVKHSYSR